MFFVCLRLWSLAGSKSIGYRLDMTLRSPIGGISLIISVHYWQLRFLSLRVTYSLRIHSGRIEGAKLILLRLDVNRTNQDKVSVEAQLSEIFLEIFGVSMAHRARPLRILFPQIPFVTIKHKFTQINTRNELNVMVSTLRSAQSHDPF